MPYTREAIAERAAAELPAGSYVNLGIGLPTLVADYLDASRQVVLHSENGVLGAGRRPPPGEEDDDLINAGKEPITLNRWAACFDSATSFAMIRGGHIDVAVLGGMQVAANGDLANWMAPGSTLKGMGGAMDLVAGARRVLVLMMHATAGGVSKLVERCTLPLTGAGVVQRLITDLGVFDVHNGSFHLIELAPGVSSHDVARLTAGPLVLPN